MNSLYPLKFQPILKEKIWGGHKIGDILGKKINKMPNCGESWEISGVQDEISVVSNGFLAGNDLQELIEVYFGDMVGDKVYNKFGLEFPLLIKFIDANDYLSIQVHPNDTLAKRRHKAYGKTEMWYVIQAEDGAQLISGFNAEVDKEIFVNHLKSKTLTEILNQENVKEGDVFFLPAGRIHAIGSGILLAEIQQTSDITYRVYDYDRKDSNGKPRALHTDLALDAIDFEYHKNYRTEYATILNNTTKIIECPYFKTNTLIFNQTIVKDYNLIDSFVIYICIDGAFEIHYEEAEEPVLMQKGETVLIPALVKNLELKPTDSAKILEVYIV